MTIGVSKLPYLADIFHELNLLNSGMQDRNEKFQEELASISSDRTLKLKYSELSLDAFWLLVEKEYPVISQKALRLLLLFSTSHLCEFGFSALTTIKHKKQAQLLSVEDELRVVCEKRDPILKSCVRNTRLKFLIELFMRTNVLCLLFVFLM